MRNNSPIVVIKSPSNQELPFAATIAYARMDSEDDKRKLVQYILNMQDKGYDVQPQVITNYSVFTYTSGHLIQTADGRILTNHEFENHNRDIRREAEFYRNTVEGLKTVLRDLQIAENTKTIVVNDLIPTIQKKIEEIKSTTLVEIKPEITADIQIGGRRNLSALKDYVGSCCPWLGGFLNSVNETNEQWDEIGTLPPIEYDNDKTVDFRHTLNRIPSLQINWCPSCGAKDGIHPRLYKEFTKSAISTNFDEEDPTHIPRRTVKDLQKLWDGLGK